MQDLKYPWIVGESYTFEHINKYWKGDVVILGYGKRHIDPEVADFVDNEGYTWVEVKFLKDCPACLGEEPIKLNADARWRYEIINIDLENK